jgi:hypothetical protein
MLCNISNSTGPVGYGETQWEDGSLAASSTGEDLVKDLIFHANTVSIVSILNHYGLHVLDYKSKLICPFKSHKNGHENTASFWYYPDNNSFHCFGCNRGSKPVDFVMEMDQCNAEAAVSKILKVFANEVDEESLIDITNPSEKLEIMMKFSNKVFEFRQSHNDKHALEFIEYISWVYDQSNNNHIHNNESLNSLVIRCIEYIEIYNPKLNLIFEKGYMNG